jgi:thiosulfate dehydrogenase
MRKNKILTFLLVLCAVSLLFVSSLAESAEGTDTLTPDVYEKVLQGGLLYDKWYAETGLDLNGSHPSYPAAGKKGGAGTWRCKECHGWDYRGKDGAYAKGSHFTGIKGIREYAGESTSVIKEVLEEDIHGYGTMMPNEAYEALSFFVAYGQIDMNTYIDVSTKRVSGNIINGAKIYASTCIKCHGADGKKINFKTPEQPEYLGTVANKNPWETLHKIRFGQPSTEMVNLLFLDIESQVDVLSYCQTLPAQ